MNPGTTDNFDNQDDAGNGIDVDNLTLDQINMDPGQKQDNNSADGSSSDDSGSQDGNQADVITKTSDTTKTTSDDKSKDDNQGAADQGGSGSAADAKTSAAAQADDVDDDQISEEDFRALSEETGVAVTSDEDIVSALTELATLRKSSKEQSYSDLSPAIQEAIKVEKAGGNLADHFARVGMDFDNMDARDVLRQQFFRTEQKLYSTNPKFAQVKFDRTYRERYGLWDAYQKLTSDEERTDFAEEHGMDNIEYEKMMLEADTQLARSELNEWKKTAAPVVGQQNQSTEQMSPEEADKYATDYRNQVKQSWDGFQSVLIPMGEGQNDFALGLNDITRPTVEGWIDNPATFLKDIGFNGKEIDTDRLLPIMTLIAEAANGNLGGRIAKYVVNADNIETFKKQIDKPVSTTTSTTSQERDGGDIWDQIGEAAEKARESQS